MRNKGMSFGAVLFFLTERQIIRICILSYEKYLIFSFILNRTVHHLSNEYNQMSHFKSKTTKHQRFKLHYMRPSVFFILPIAEKKKFKCSPVNNRFNCCIFVSLNPPGLKSNKKLT